MSFSFQYNPEPGIVSDIIKLLTIKLNPKGTWAPLSTLANSFDSDVEYIENFSKEFCVKYSKLLLFFYKMPNHPATFMSEKLIDHLKQDFNNFSLSTFLSALLDPRHFKNDLFSYYLGIQDYTRIKIEPIVRKSNILPDKIKILLLGYLLDSETYLRHLSTQMENFYNILYPYHASPNTDFVLTEETINRLIDAHFSNPIELKQELSGITFSYSYCFSIPHHLFCNFHSENPWLIFAPASLQTIRQNDTDCTPLSITEIARALSDPTRITILQLLFSHEYLSIKDLLPHVKCSRSTLSHHLALLENTNLILSQTQDTIKKYKCNSVGFQKASSIFHQISKGEFLS